jgi:hypothetical protein
MKASDDPNYNASDAPRKDPQQNEWNQQEAPPCYPKYPAATAEHRAKHSRKMDTVASVGMITPEDVESTLAARQLGVAPAWAANVWYQTILGRPASLV